MLTAKEAEAEGGRRDYHQQGEAEASSRTLYRLPHVAIEIVPPAAPRRLTDDRPFPQPPPGEPVRIDAEFLRASGAVRAHGPGALERVDDLALSE
jgi:hypothetical protein